MALLNIVIGIVFVMLLFSLLASTIMELVSSFMSLRGKMLAKALRNMLQDQTVDFFKHPYFKQLQNGSNANPSNRFTAGVEPSYINPETFSAIVLDMLLANGRSVAEGVDDLPEGNMKDMLHFVMRKSGDDPSTVSKQLELWFNDVMDRLSGSFKRTIQGINFVIGIGLAIGFNVDPMTIYHSLSVNAAFRESLVGSAGNFVDANAARSAGMQQIDGFVMAKDKVSNLVASNIHALESPLGIGWGQVDHRDINFRWWFLHLVGWFVTALSITLGSSFWFDLLKSLVNMRGSGPAPATTILLGNGNKPPEPYYPTAGNSPFNFNPFDTPASQMRGAPMAPSADEQLYDMPAMEAEGVVESAAPEESEDFFEHFSGRFSEEPEAPPTENT
jgi:hypothetical protein